MIPINSIGVPSWFLAISADWHGGADCVLYTVSEAGGVYIGTDCPLAGYADNIRRKKYLTLWRDLSVAIGYALQAADKAGCSGNVKVLGEFKRFAETVCADLEESYGLADWSI